MKSLKQLLIVLLIIIAIPFIVALFIPREFKAERDIVIGKPIREVFDYVKYVRNQDNFGIWQLSDPNSTVKEEGIDGTVGYAHHWDGKKVGKGSQTITEIIESEKMETQLDFGFGEPTTAYFLTQEISPTSTEVTWGMTGKSPYPFNLMGLFYDPAKDLEQGLENLKELLESGAAEKSALHNYYRQTLNDLRKSIEGLSKEQLHFKPNSNKWSVIECVEHIVISEPMLFEWLKNVLEQPANPESRTEIEVQDKDIAKMVTNREYKAKAPAEMTPTGKYDDVEKALNDLQVHRQKILEALSAYTMDDLRNHVLDLPTGKADAYQFALFIAGHTARHTLQIEEVKAQKNFPKK